MQIHISGHGVGLSPAIRRRVESKLGKVARFLPKITETRVVLGRERHRHLAEVTLSAKGATLHAEAAAGDFHAAVDLAIEHLEQQVRRRKDRIRARKPRLSRRPLRDVGPVEEAAPPAGDVIIRRLDIKPMSVDEAVEQMRLRSDGFLVFTNAKSRVVNVLRRRPDGQLELVQPSGASGR
ncbi:MAG TPA: ribosome-associated translation inhibitor RaiA [Methylomirabilota bacterium]|jgi:putative sigma-54 modulation protein|nr:ribosome-associated translation inhibitor RaiA [Methylomirabilota bacterium]